MRQEPRGVPPHAGVSERLRQYGHSQEIGDEAGGSVAHREQPSCEVLLDHHAPAAAPRRAAKIRQMHALARGHRFGDLGWQCPVDRRVLSDFRAKPLEVVARVARRRATFSYFSGDYAARGSARPLGRL